MRWLYTEMVYLSADSHPLKQPPLDSHLTESQNKDLSIVSLTPYHYDSKQPNHL